MMQHISEIKRLFAGRICAMPYTGLSYNLKMLCILPALVQLRGLTALRGDAPSLPRPQHHQAQSASKNSKKHFSKASDSCQTSHQASQK
jgi:hypothetical protein